MSKNSGIYDLHFTKLKGNILHLAAKDREKFTQLVLPYIHKDCIYKLHGIH